MAKSKSRNKRRFQMILVVLAVGALGTGVVAFVRGVISSGPPQTKKVVQEIHVIRPPPPPPDQPPPPPPPPEEKVNRTRPRPTIRRQASSSASMRKAARGVTRSDWSATKVAATWWAPVAAPSCGTPGF
jgi:hypothetical protein